ncbi:MAG: hypothetical protein D6720_11665 [Gammaproteobacteria bacterium]|nr:MAG: hypothetical protein D6720_11665 [Gammaproteobacteria bacterium]
MKIPFQDVVMAFDFVNFGDPYEHEAYIDLDTGNIYYHSAIGANEEELPEDIDDPDRYIALPHKSDLGLGKPLVLNFAYGFLPDEADEIEDIFRRRGAYGRFKALLERKGMLEKWYEFENEAQEKALREWCEESGIAIKD